MKVDVIIPVYKPDASFWKVIEKIEHQTVKPNKLILMNTEEKYFLDWQGEKELTKEYDNIVVQHLTKAEFDHGKTRSQGVLLSDADIFVMMTQDATPDNEFLLEELLKGLEDPMVGSCYGRQLPNPDCKPLEAYLREFNYPGESQVKSIEDMEKLGIKTFFCSDVCCAYKREVYDQVGGFIQKAIFNEDMIYAYSLLQTGYKICYRAQARVLHSHNYSGSQQFHRNFDLGVSQAQNAEIFGQVKSESEGIRSVKNAAAYLKSKGQYLEIIKLIYHSGCKFIGYRLGKKYASLPKSWVKAFSMNKDYWN